MDRNRTPDGRSGPVCLVNVVKIHQGGSRPTHDDESILNHEVGLWRVEAKVGWMNSQMSVEPVYQFKWYCKGLETARECDL